jgi:hypothetical protein
MRFYQIILTLAVLTILISTGRTLDITVPIPSPSIITSVTTIQSVQTVTKAPDFFNDQHAVNELFVLVATILGSIATISTTICVCKKKLRKAKGQVNKLNQQIQLPTYHQ